MGWLVGGGVSGGYGLATVSNPPSHYAPPGRGG